MSDYGRDRIPAAQWTRPVFNEYQEILKRLAALDEKLAQPDCVDPSKAEWMKAIEQRLNALESVVQP